MPTLTNINIVTSGNETRPARITVENGKIVALDDEYSKNNEVIDCKNLLLIPGAIDPHTHFNDPGYTWREDFYHGSLGAVAGGVTTVFDMPCTTIPPVTNINAFYNKKEKVIPNAWCDFRLWGGISAESLDSPLWKNHIEQLKNAGVIGFKTYVLSGMDTFHQLSYEEYYDILKFASEIDVLVGVHAEDPEIVANATAQIKENSPAEFAASRPVEAEVTAIRRVGEIAGEVGAKIHIVHVSSGSGAEEIDRLQKQGVNISGETCPQYLAFTIDDLCRLGSVLKCTPPVRSKEENEKLWSFLGKSVSFLATDHAPCSQKEKSTGDFMTDYSGMPGVELLLPFALNYGYHQEKLTLEQIQKLTSENTAKRFDLFPQKGSLEIGSDADFALINLNSMYKIEAEKLKSKGKFTPFDGTTFCGAVEQTWISGEPVFKRREQK
ncbi:MAG: allantoinase AllB [Chlamydiae bacterium]|nr:MAG: allantoinase AllB [Chlamydiota bacterium]